jgi:hypothetical protein
MVDDLPIPGESPRGSRALRYALELVAQGYYVAPVIIRRDPRTGKKVGDYLRVRWHDESTNDPAQVLDWYAQHGDQLSFLVDSGRSGVFVCDLDVTPTESGEAVWNAARLPLGSMVVRTPGGGYHHYFRARPGESLTVHKRLHGYPIDVRGDGGHVYAPGSVVIDAHGEPELRGYELTGVGTGQIMPAADLLPVPEVVTSFLHATVSEPRRVTAQGEPVERSVLIERCKDQLDRVASHPRATESGFRSALLGAAMVLGRAVAGGLLSREKAVGRLEKATTAVWARVDPEDRRWIRDGLDDGIADPWTVVPDGWDPEMITSKINSTETVTQSDSPTSDDPETFDSEIRTGPSLDADLNELDEADTWAPVDLGPYLDGTVLPSRPSVGIVRSDGHQLIYPGLEHAVIGEMESGKSWFALACVAAELRAGHRVIYAHFEESSPADTIERLILLGVEPEVIRTLFAFVGPERRITSGDVDRLLALGTPSLVVLDGQNEAMALHGQGINDPDGVAEFRRRLVKPFTRVGAAVVELDHVVKDPEKKGQGYALGSAHKGNGINGALFLVENLEPFGRGRNGASVVSVTKDRPAQLRQLGLPTLVARKFWVGTLHVENEPGTPAPNSWRMRFEPPRVRDDAPDAEVDFLGQERGAMARNAELDDRVYTAVVELDAKGISVTSNKVRVEVGARRTDVSDSLDRLESAGRIKNTSLGQGARWVPSPTASR